ncbi:hypothetical protein L7F22_000141 [Adiantum nelumboides]|nr:hypothetical protein [Adiantum nelumboides]
MQDDPRQQPALLLELVTPTNTLVKEMSLGIVRIALECEREPRQASVGANVDHVPQWSQIWLRHQKGLLQGRLGSAHLLPVHLHGRQSSA